MTNAHRYFSHPVLLPVQYSTSYRFKDTGGSQDTLTAFEQGEALWERVEAAGRVGFAGGGLF